CVRRLGRRVWVSRRRLCRWGGAGEAGLRGGQQARARSRERGAREREAVRGGGVLWGSALQRGSSSGAVVPWPPGLMRTAHAGCRQEAQPPPDPRSARQGAKAAPEGLGLRARWGAAARGREGGEPPP